MYIGSVATEPVLLNLICFYFFYSPCHLNLFSKGNPCLSHYSFSPKEVIPVSSFLSTLLTHLLIYILALIVAHTVSLKWISSWLLLSKFCLSVTLSSPVQSPWKRALGTFLLAQGLSHHYLQFPVWLQKNQLNAYERILKVGRFWTGKTHIASKWEMRYKSKLLLHTVQKPYGRSDLCYGNFAVGNYMFSSRSTEF